MDDYDRFIVRITYGAYFPRRFFGRGGGGGRGRGGGGARGHEVGEMSADGSRSEAIDRHFSLLHFQGINPRLANVVVDFGLSKERGNH